MKLDKILHVGAGYAVYLTVVPLGMEWAALATIVAAVGKEVYDKYFGGTVDHYDAVATVAGGVLAGAVSAVISNFLFSSGGAGV